MDELSSSVRILARLQHGLYDWLLSQGFGPDVSVLMTALAGVVAMLVLAVVTDVLARLVLARLIPGAVNKLFGSERSAVWQAALRRQMLTRRSAHIVAALAAYLMTPQVLSAYPTVVVGVQNLIEGYVILVIIIAINAVLRATADVSRHEGWSTGLPPNFLAQTGQAVVWLVGSMLVISAVFDQSVGVLLTSLAGMTAVLMLVFRDSLLGFVAGIQIVNNDLVREGDRIDIPKYGADGPVIDIGLMTVRVRNFDNTISSVPSYALISDGFKNWRGMQEAGGRRIMRALPIDMSGVCF